jgi:hypothetical protein
VTFITLHRPDILSINEVRSGEVVGVPLNSSGIIDIVHPAFSGSSKEGNYIR